MRAVKIIWDVDNAEDLQNLPTEMDLPNGMTDPDEISDYLSDTTGFCHKGFSVAYQSGIEFFQDMEREYGSEEALRKAENYLEIPISHMTEKDQKEEAVFREELMAAMRGSEEM